MPKNTSFFIPSAEKPLISSHTPQPSASALERVMKTIWNALRDMLNMDHAVRRRGPDGQTHQAREEQRGEAHDTENHFSLGNEMHEVSRHQEGLHAGNRQRHRDVNFPAAKLDERRPHRQKRPRQQGDENKDVAAHGMRRLRRPTVIHCHTVIHYQSKYKTGNRKIQIKSTKCQNRPETSMRLVKRSGSVFHRSEEHT